MGKFKIGDRVRFNDKQFLSDGTIKSIVKNGLFEAYIIKLDDKAPNEYAYNTDEVLSFGSDIRIING